MEDELKARIAELEQRVTDDADYVRSLRADVATLTSERDMALLLSKKNREDNDALKSQAARLTVEHDAFKAQVAAMRDSLGLAVRMYAHRELLANHPDCGAWVNQARALLSAPNPAEGYTLVADETLRRVRDFVEDRPLLDESSALLDLLPEVKP